MESKNGLKGFRGERTKKIISLRLLGKSICEIAREVDCKRQRVYAVLKRDSHLIPPELMKKMKKKLSTPSPVDTSL